MSEIDLKNPSLYINRELSNIEFNRRVLEECENPEHPLLERVKFLAIFSGNMDEFFMVRVSGLKQQVLLGITDRPADGLTPREQLVAIHRTVTQLFAQANSYWLEMLQPALAKEGIHALNYGQLKARQQKKLAAYFEQEIFPVLTPLVFDPTHPFPHISNLSLNLAVEVRDPDNDEIHFARVKVPATLPRLVPLNPLDPDELLPPTTQKFIWLEQIIAANLDRLFPGMDVCAAYPFRVTRNTDMEIQEEEADDLLLTMEENLRQRHFGRVVRLEIDEETPDILRNILVSNLKVNATDVYATNGPLGLSSLWELHKLERPELKDEGFQPTVPANLRTGDSIFNILQRNNVLIHTPFDSFLPVVDFVQAAAEDPNVLAIKQTLYRVGPNPPIVHALMKARENGKQVAVLVELKARFDEESNIEWAKALEKAGVHVAYGVIGLKTHCKLCLVVRRERDGIRRYVHMATGNYNTITARLYTDLGMISSDDEMGADASEVFNYLTGYSKQVDYRKFLVAPVNLRSNLLRLIEQETDLGKKGRILIKANSLVDPGIIRSLYRASQAGVQIDLIIRGFCCLRPGVKGVSDNIRVKSIVGRFLEHSRIYYFHNKGNPDIYVGSADPMPRNINRRVEVLFPIEEEAERQQIITILATYLHDTAKSHLLQSDGRYLPAIDQLGEGEEPFNSQLWLLNGRHADKEPPFDPTILPLPGDGKQ
ncbi:polyphosphate kinase 1 [Candidatus Leptofilum sp.]|uniref:polyphosphate kinase 1 n=1 Tax=Candidatus Leptofilum sp. TaxID=3241576 RepID=UPI003B58F845